MLPQQSQQTTARAEDVIYSVTDGISSFYTKREYHRNFKHFLDCSGLNPETLVKQAKDNPRFIESLIINHIRFLAEKQKLTHRSIHIHCYAIFHFLEMNDITTINKKKIKRFVPPDESTKDDRAYTHEEIADILLKCDERGKVVVLLMGSTGMRVGAIHTLQIKDLERIPEYNLYKISVYSNSPKDRYYTFCTPECAAAIDSYLQYRHLFGETPIKPLAPLVREQFNIDDPFHIQHPKPLKPDTTQYIMKQVLKRSGKKTSEVMQTHGFRKFAITQMIKAKVDYSAREYLVGHKHSRGLDVNYDRTTEEDRLQEYLKAVDLLTINSEHRLKLQIHQMKAEHSAEWNQLKEQMAELKKVLEHKV